MTNLNKNLGDSLELYRLDVYVPEDCFSEKYVLSVTLDQTVESEYVIQPLYDEAFEYIHWIWYDCEDEEYFELLDALEESEELDYYFDKYEKNSLPKKR